MADILKLVNGSGGRATSPLPEVLSELPELTKLGDVRARELVSMIDAINPRDPKSLAELGNKACDDLTVAMKKLAQAAEGLLDQDPAPNFLAMNASLSGLIVSDSQERARKNLGDLIARQDAPGRALRKKLTQLKADFETAGEAISALRVGRENAQLDLRDAFRAAVTAFDELSLAIVAGRERATRDVGKLAEDYDRALDLEIEERGAAADAALPALRAVRDNIERRVHMLRGVRNSALKTLPLARQLSDGEGELNVALADFLRVGLSEWDKSTAEIIGQTANNRSVDVGVVENSCADLATAIGLMLDADANLSEVRGEMRLAVELDAAEQPRDLRKNIKTEKEPIPGQPDT